MTDAHLQFTVTIRDAKGKHGKFQLWAYVPLDGSESNPFDVYGYCQLLAEKIDPLVKGQIISVNGTVLADLPPGLKAAPLPDSDVEEGAIWHWYADNSAKAVTRLPTFDEAFLSTPGATEVVDFETLIFLANDVYNQNVVPSTGKFEPIRGFEDYEESFRK